MKVYSKSSQLCIYDKKLEQELKKKKKVYEKVWFRYEMRLKGAKADAFVKDYLVNVLQNKGNIDFGKLLSSTLFSMLDVKVKNENDSNKNRWETEPFWLNFLGSVEKIQIVSTRRNDLTIDKKKDYIKRSVGKTLAQVYLTDGSNFLSELLELVGVKLHDFKDKDLEVVNKFMRDNNLKEYDKKALMDISKNLLPDLDDDEVEKFRNSIFSKLDTTDDET